MALARTSSIAVTGIAGCLVDVEADVSQGLPGLTFTGLPDVAVNEARDRVRAAVLNTGLPWPNRRITVALLPADVRKSGSVFDLALALSVLAASGEVRPASIEGVVCLGELGLDGRLRGIRGVLPAVLAARAAGVRRCIVPHENAAEASLVTDIEVLSARSLAAVVGSLRGTASSLESVPEPVREPDDPGEDLADVVGQPFGRWAVEVAAAGGHNLLLSGSPGAGKTMLAARLPGVLPPLSDDHALEVTAIHSIAGLLADHSGLVRRAPFQSPHHTSSMSALVGGGSGIARPGAVTLAHRGVLFLDEAAEFSPRVLDSLRQPLESGRVVLHRSGGSVEYPARFQLVLAMNPCPCAAARGVDCSCTAEARRRYQTRLSRPLLDRIDLQIDVLPVGRADLMDDFSERESSRIVAERVRLARDTARQRWRDIGWVTNAEVPGPLLRQRSWRPARSAMEPLERALELGQLTARGCDRVLKLAWTLSDLAGGTSPGRPEVDAAIELRIGTGMVAA